VSRTSPMQPARRRGPSTTTSRARRRWPSRPCGGTKRTGGYGWASCGKRSYCRCGDCGSTSRASSRPWSRRSSCPAAC
jgi:hypothetical protein